MRPPPDPASARADRTARAARTLRTPRTPLLPPGPPPGARPGRRLLPQGPLLLALAWPLAPAHGAPAAVPLPAPVQASMQRAGCLNCHAVERRLVGPSFRSIAARYRGQPAVPSLMAKVRSGGNGSFGQVAMTPTPPERMDDATLRAAIEAILQQ